MSAIQDAVTCHKQAFTSPQKAMQHAKAGNSCRSLRAYQCKECRMYHLTSQPEVPQRKRSAMDTRRFKR